MVKVLVVKILAAKVLVAKVLVVSSQVDSSQVDSSQVGTFLMDRTQLIGFLVARTQVVSFPVVRTQVVKTQGDRIPVVSFLVASFLVASSPTDRTLVDKILDAALLRLGHLRREVAQLRPARLDSHGRMEPVLSPSPIVLTGLIPSLAIRRIIRRTSPVPLVGSVRAVVSKFKTGSQPTFLGLALTASLDPLSLMKRRSTLTLMS